MRTDSYAHRTISKEKLIPHILLTRNSKSLISCVWTSSIVYRFFFTAEQRKGRKERRNPAQPPFSAHQRNQKDACAPCAAEACRTACAPLRLAVPSRAAALLLAPALVMVMVLLMALLPALPPPRAPLLRSVARRIYLPSQPAARAEPSRVSSPPPRGTPRRGLWARGGPGGSDSTTFLRNDANSFSPSVVQ
jgi:hypothetical protein